VTTTTAPPATQYVAPLPVTAAKAPTETQYVAPLPVTAAKAAEADAAEAPRSRAPKQKGSRARTASPGTPAPRAAGAPALRHEDADKALRRTDMVHIAAFMIGGSLLLWINSLQVVSLAASALSGLAACLIVQARVSQRESIFGIYFAEKDTWVPPLFGVVVAVVSGACVPYRRQIPILYSQAIVMFQVGIMRLMDISPVSLEASGQAALSVYCIVSVCLLVGSLPLAFRLVQSHQNDVCAFSSLQLGVLAVVSVIAHFAQRAAFPASHPFSPMDDYLVMFQQIRDSTCVAWDVGAIGAVVDGQADATTVTTLCTVGPVCKMVYVAWIAGSYVLFVVWLVVNRASDRGNYRPLDLAAEEEEDFSEDAGYSEDLPEPPPARGGSRGGSRVEPTTFGRDEDDDFWAKVEDDDNVNFRKLQEDLDHMIQEKGLHTLEADLEDAKLRKARAVQAEDFPLAKSLKKKVDELELTILKLKNAG